jgi:hypothetical protein
VKINFGLIFDNLEYNQYVRLQSCSKCRVYNLANADSFLKTLSKNNPSGGYYYRRVSQS